MLILKSSKRTPAHLGLRYSKGDVLVEHKHKCYIVHYYKRLLDSIGLSYKYSSLIKDKRDKREVNGRSIVFNGLFY